MATDHHRESPYISDNSITSLTPTNIRAITHFGEPHDETKEVHKNNLVYLEAARISLADWVTKKGKVVAPVDVLDNKHPYKTEDMTVEPRDRGRPENEHNDEHDDHDDEEDPPIDSPPD